MILLTVSTLTHLMAALVDKEQLVMTPTMPNGRGQATARTLLMWTRAACCCCGRCVAAWLPAMDVLLAAQPGGRRERSTEKVLSLLAVRSQHRRSSSRPPTKRASRSRSARSAAAPRRSSNAASCAQRPHGFKASQWTCLGKGAVNRIACLLVGTLYIAAAAMPHLVHKYHMDRRKGGGRVLEDAVNGVLCVFVRTLHTGPR